MGDQFVSIPDAPKDRPRQLARSETANCVIVTVAYNSRSRLARLLERIHPPMPVIVVDNSAREEDITDLVRARPMTRYIDTGGNIGFGAACNLAACNAKEPFLAFVNPDAEVDGSVVDELVRYLATDDRCISAGPLLVDADGSIRSGSGGWLPTPSRALVHATGLFRLLPDRGIWMGPPKNDITDVQWVAGTCLVIRADVFRELGGFASHYFLYQEDMDLGRRVSDRGYRQAVVGYVRVRHVAGTSSAVTDIRRVAWYRSSALVGYLTETDTWLVARLICAILATGTLLRAAWDLAAGRAGRAAEFGVQLNALMFPRRTLRLLRARASKASVDAVTIERAPNNHAATSGAAMDQRALTSSIRARSSDLARQVGQK